MYKREDFTVGQTLWYVNTQRRDTTGGYAVTITKVGHKFLTVSTYVGGFTERVEIESLAVDGGQYVSPAQCYLSEQHYIEHKELLEANSKFLDKIRGLSLYRSRYSLEVIAQVEKLLEL